MPARPETPLYLALFCGLVPMAVGTLALLGWWATGYMGFQLLGVFTIFAGVLLFLVGIGAAGWYLWTAYDTRRRPVRAWLVPGAVACAILVGNFPLSALYVWLSGRETVRVVNATGATVTSFVVTDPAGSSWELGPVPPGKTAKRSFTFGGPDGAVSFRATVRGQVVQGNVIDYYTEREGAVWTVTLNPDGTSGVKRWR